MPKTNPIFKNMNRILYENRFCYNSICSDGLRYWLYWLAIEIWRIKNHPLYSLNLFILFHFWKTYCKRIRIHFRTCFIYFFKKISIWIHKSFRSIAWINKNSNKQNCNGTLAEKFDIHQASLNINNFWLFTFSDLPKNLLTSDHKKLSLT